MEENRNRVFSALVGAGCGFVMALAVLFAFIRTGYASGLGEMAVVMVIASVLPWLLDSLHIRGVRTVLAECMMIGVSFIITAAYSILVTAGDGFAVFFQQMRFHLLMRCVFVHLTAFAFLLVRKQIRKRGEKQK